jgi:hypothetical protein
MAKTLATSLLPAFILILPTGAQAADALLCGRVNGAERTSAHVVVYTSASEPSGDDKIEIDACVPIPTVDSGSECAVAFRGKVADLLSLQWVGPNELVIGTAALRSSKQQQRVEIHRSQVGVEAHSTIENARSHQADAQRFIGQRTDFPPWSCKAMPPPVYVPGISQPGRN